MVTSRRLPGLKGAEAAELYGRCHYRPPVPTAIASDVAEVRRANLTYAELGRRLEAHGLKETGESNANKLNPGNNRGDVVFGDAGGFRP
jgi:hypothetical protein